MDVGFRKRLPATATPGALRHSMASEVSLIGIWGRSPALADPRTDAITAERIGSVNFVFITNRYVTGLQILDKV